MKPIDRKKLSGKERVAITPTFSIEVITVPVSDVERALRFYVDQVGFTLDVDYSPNDAFRVVQLTPPGSSCSIQIDNGLTDARRFISQRLSRCHRPRGRAEPPARKWGRREIRHKMPIPFSKSDRISLAAFAQHEKRHRQRHCGGLPLRLGVRLAQVTRTHLRWFEESREPVHLPSSPC